MLTLVSGNDESNIWDRREDESDKAWSAFELFRSMGSTRSLAEVSRRLSKSRPLMWRWSRNYEWQRRVNAWDRHSARIINNAILAGTADMRARQIKAACALQDAAERRALTLTPAEIAELRPIDVAALLKIGSEVERRAREFEGDEFAFASETPPVFQIQVITPGCDKEGNPMVGVQLMHDGQQRYGYIPHDQVERFRRDHPEAVVLI